MPCTDIMYRFFAPVAHRTTFIAQSKLMPVKLILQLLKYKTIKLKMYEIDLFVTILRCNDIVVPIPCYDIVVVRSP